MKLYVQILDDNNEVVGEHEADACQPSVWNAPAGKALIGKMPKNSDQENTGTYELFRITFQPVTRVQRPNGYKEPPPNPLTGQTGVKYPAGFPADLFKQPWSKPAPTPQQTNSPTGVMPMRG